MLGEKYAGYYGYDAKGERVYKLTGTSGIDQVNAGYSYSNAVFDWCVMYPNPYIVITPKGYTKHYYAGAERIATVLGGGGFEDQKYPVVSLDTQHDKDIINAFNLNYKNYDPFNHEKRLSDPLPTATTDGNTLPELDYQCNAILLEHLDILSKQDMLLGILKNNSTENSEEKEIFYFHGDHLGSASWITETNGKPIQYIHYAPYGELIDNQQTINYDERYKFTGKERDAESGYDYFGARYYASPFSFWLSVDPLADKYPAISPYAYCTWNPIKFIDPDGKAVETGWDMINVGMDAVSLNENIASGNVPEAIVDGVCLIYDLAATAIPGYPASAGTLKNTIKTGVSNASVDIVNKCVQVVKKLLIPNKYNYRHALQIKTKNLGLGYEAHHTLPQKFRDFFEKLGINIDDPENVVWRNKEMHRKYSNAITEEWTNFIKNLKAPPSKEEIYKFRDSIEIKYFNNTKGDI